MVFTEATGLEKLYGMVAYCIDFRRCRRSILADHFGEVWDSTTCRGMCDNCNWRDEQNLTQFDISELKEVAAKAIAQAAEGDSKLTALKLLNVLVGSTAVVGKLRVPGWSGGRGTSRRTGELAIAALLLKGVLKEDFLFTPYNTISYIVLGPTTSKTSIVIDVPKETGETAEVERKKKKRRPDKVSGDAQSKRIKDAAQVICLE